MFCCQRKESHKSEIVTAVCLQDQCKKTKNQLACILCLQEEHKGHEATSMRIIIPELLEVHSDKTASESKLLKLMEFISSQFGQQFMSGQITTKDNITERAMELLINLKREVQSTNEEISKMKVIFKNLNRSTNSQLISNKQSSPNKSSEYSQFLKDPSSPTSPLKSQIGMITRSKAFSPIGNYKVEIDIFAISAKHPYLNLSPDLRTVTKVSHSGHRFAAIGAKPFSEQQQQIRLKIDKSVSGNIMLGVCHQSIVRDKDFTNCYGINSGTYLIGQNGNNPTTAISFHHCLSVMNRKEVVGWNFEAGDEIVVGINFQDEVVYFRREGKRIHSEFTMKLRGENKLQASLNEGGLRLVVLLQTEGDQITIIQHS